ncbi:MAG: response regulator [Egibacteraceae bacterium]
MTTLRVLVAEDDDDHRYLTVRALRRTMQGSTEILEARDGEETLDWLFGRGAHAHAAPPNLVFLDLQMPKASGFDVLERLQGHPELAAIPVIVVTSSRQREDIDTAYALGSNSYVSKASGRRLVAHLQQVAEYWTRNSELPVITS